jgi:hypothetical protein
MIQAEQPYTMVSTEFLRDQTISFTAKGLLGYLIALPNDAEMGKEDVLAMCEKDSISSLESAWSELENARYIEKQTENDMDLYTVYLEPNI